MLLRGINMSRMDWRNPGGGEGKDRQEGETRKG